MRGSIVTDCAVSAPKLHDQFYRNLKTALVCPTSLAVRQETPDLPVSVCILWWSVAPVVGRLAGAGT